MTRSRKLLITGATALALGAGAVGIAQAVNGDSDEQATGPDADRAKQAAVQSVGGGRAVAVERNDEGGAGWEVEVVGSDGRQVEVQLNQKLERVGVQSDDDGPGDEGEGQDD
jgi:uncharacterized membrane protein YkoI